MTNFRDFSSSDECQPVARTIDADAPSSMRQELIDLIFHIAEQNSEKINDELIHQIIHQSLGMSAAGQPYSGYRYAAGRDINKVEWPRVYDLICRIWPEFNKLGIKKIVTGPSREVVHKGPVIEYREGVNRILSAYGIVWDLTDEGRLQRCLPKPAQAIVEASITELKKTEFMPALSLMNAARDAYDDQPRRDRDACSNIFDSLESVAKTVFKMPDSTFGQVVHKVRQSNFFTSEITGMLESINKLRNKNFGHGMTYQFSLSATEVEFTYLSCIGAILLFLNTK